MTDEDKNSTRLGVRTDHETRGENGSPTEIIEIIEMNEMNVGDLFEGIIAEQTTNSNETNIYNTETTGATDLGTWVFSSFNLKHFPQICFF